jgi:hypothetical protein
MLLALLPALLSPVVRVVGLALAALAIVASIYVKGRVDEHGTMVKHEQAALAELKKEQKDEIAAAEAARAAAEKKFDAGRYNARPSGVRGRLRPRPSDGFSRD